MVVQHNLQQAHRQNQLRNYLPVTKSTVQQMMQQDFPFLRK